MSLLAIVAACGAAALAFAFVKSKWINAQDGGTERMTEIGGYIRDGAMAFLTREYKVLAIFVVIVAALLGVSNADNEQSHGLVAVAFVVGAIASAAAGYFRRGRNGS